MSRIIITVDDGRNDVIEVPTSALAPRGYTAKELETARHEAQEALVVDVLARYPEAAKAVQDSVDARKAELAEREQAPEPVFVPDVPPAEPVDLGDVDAAIKR